MVNETKALPKAERLWTKDFVLITIISLFTFLYG